MEKEENSIQNQKPTSDEVEVKENDNKLNYISSTTIIYSPDLTAVNSEDSVKELINIQN